MKNEILSDLADEVYQAEDALDGCYNPTSKKTSGYNKINNLYGEILKNLNNLLKEIDIELNKR